MIFEQTLPELSKILHMDESLVLNEQGQVTLTFDDKWDITFQLDKINNDVIFYLPLLEMDASLLDKIPVLDLLNMKCCLGVSSAGYAMSYLEELNTPVLWRHFRNQFADANEVASLASRLLDVAKALIAMLPELEKVATEVEKRIQADNVPQNSMHVNFQTLRMFV